MQREEEVMKEHRSHRRGMKVVSNRLIISGALARARIIIVAFTALISQVCSVLAMGIR